MHLYNQDVHVHTDNQDVHVHTDNQDVLYTCTIHTYTCTCIHNLNVPHDSSCTHQCSAHTGRHWSGITSTQYELTTTQMN